MLNYHSPRLSGAWLIGKHVVLLKFVILISAALCKDVDQRFMSPCSILQSLHAFRVSDVSCHHKEFLLEGETVSLLFP